MNLTKACLLFLLCAHIGIREVPFFEIINPEKVFQPIDIHGVAFHVKKISPSSGLVSSLVYLYVQRKGIIAVLAGLVFFQL